MDKVKLPAEEFRALENIMLPDIRNEHFGDKAIVKFRSSIEEFALEGHVPEKLRIQFDTVKNLFLHSYYVYRFFPIVKHQLFVVLEHAIRECIGEKRLDLYRKLKNKGIPKGNPKFSRGLKFNLVFIMDHELIKNEDFSVWQIGKERAAEDKYDEFIFQKMKEDNLDSYQWNPSEIDYEGVEYDYDYLSVLLETTPALRNALAHGSTFLSPTSTLSFEITSVIINKIFERNTKN
ncbi:hypothetical protein [Colwellia ponticola]|uniref:Uncharacterized protein n=1 Tax=Colwellia ponticola TaxID=2304625 RepID=A0A8H2JM32_9GAMM|nr:hypothetical protein [Colwellia ponticola]TMM45759.1 hypothetical protein FCS21_08030 [Colwellia ponticola]